MHVLKHNLARYLIVALIGVWSHAAYQDCLAFMAPDADVSTSSDVAALPCHTQDADARGDRHDVPLELAYDHECLGVCDCGLQAIPIASQTLYVASEYKPSVDDHGLAAIAAQRFVSHRITYRSPVRHEQPAAACLHPLQRTCVQLK